MLRLKYEDIVAKIKEEKGLSDEEIANRVEQKVKQLSYLISKEGAVNIIANELGIKLYANLFKKRYNVNELVTGLRSVEIVLKVMQKYDVREFKNDKRSGKLASLFVGDETGTCRLVIWDEKVINNYFNDLKEGDIIKIANAYVKENNNGFRELHLGGNSAFVLNPENEKIDNVVTTKASYKKKRLEQLQSNDFVEVNGTVVQVFEPRFYMGCPECYKKVDEKSMCSEHGLVKERAMPILNLILDDGTDSIRVSVFRDNVEKLLGLKYDELLKLKEDISSFGEVRARVLGKQIVVTGKTNRNEMFDSLDFNANSVRELSAMDAINEILPN